LQTSLLNTSKNKTRRERERERERKRERENKRLKGKTEQRKREEERQRWFVQRLPDRQPSTPPVLMSSCQHCVFNKSRIVNNSSNRGFSSISAINISFSLGRTPASSRQ
jgi:hypothetical protein